jgi:hypothetical protein
VTQAIRTAKHEVTGHTPSFLTFGRNVPVSGDYYGKLFENFNNVPTISDKLQHISDLQEVPKLFVDIRKRISNYNLKNAKHYNLRKRDISYSVGDKLWKKNYTLSSAVNDYTAKLAPKYIPCIVNKVISKVSYNLKDMDGNDIGNWHVSDLKKNFISDEHSESDEEVKN